MTTRPTGARLAILVLGLLLVASACSTGSSTTSGSAPPPTGAVAAFAATFDAGAGHRRLVLLLSPT